MSNIVQRSFSGGEISPSLWARVDLTKYATGLKTCRNFMVMRHGGVANRPGTSFVAEVKDSTKKIKLVPFIFNIDQTYVLEFGNLYMRVHRNGAQVVETTKTISGATQANPCVVTATSHGYLNGQEVYIASVGGMIQLNGRNFKIANKTTHTYELQYMDGTSVDATGFTAYTSGGTSARVYEIVTPYTEAHLPELQHIQSADVVTLVHPSYEPRELIRTGHTAWTLSTITFGATVATPTGLASSASGTAYYYKVTAINAETGEESMPTAAVGSTTTTSTLTWNAVTGAGYYNVYRGLNNAYGWIGIAGADASPSFVDVSYVPDSLDNPPVARTPFTGTSNYPSTAAYYQQRLLFANTDNNPEAVYGSKSTLYKNYMVSTPLQDDDAVTFSLVGKQVNEIRHLLDIGKLIVFTTSGEWSIEGGPSGILAPGDVNPKQYTYNGSGFLPPLVVGGNALYVQARGSVVRDLAYDYQSDGYKGNELSIFAAHFFDNYTIVDWAYQQIPHSIVWCVRNDGALLGLTYIREHQVFGWHKHDFNGVELGMDYLADGTYFADGSILASGGTDDATSGLAENVCVVPEGTEDVLYLTINRVINGKVVRYIERMATRQVVKVEDSIFMDCSLSYDGRNTNTSHTMTLTNGVNWTYDETLTLKSSASYFTSADVGNSIFITGIDGTNIRFSISGYTSGTIATGTPQKTVPLNMRDTALPSWGKGVDVVSGLWHLEGRAVSVTVDGFVSASPNNTGYGEKTVIDGKITLHDPHAVIHVGLPYVSDIETLNIDIIGVSSMTDKKKLINKLTMFVESSRGIWAGSDADNLTEFKLRSNEGYDDPVNLATGTIDLNIKADWKTNGSLFVRQIDPLPLAILAVVPTGYIG